MQYQKNKDYNNAVISLSVELNQIQKTISETIQIFTTFRNFRDHELLKHQFYCLSTIHAYYEINAFWN